MSESETTSRQPGWFLKLVMAFGWRGSYCPVCGFSTAAHYKPDLEFDIDHHPCEIKL